MPTYAHALKEALYQVFREARYATLAGLTSLAAFILAVWMPNLGLIAELISDSNIPLGARLEAPFNFLGGIATNFSLLSASYTVAFALLFGANLAMIVFYLQKRKAMLKQSGLASSVGVGSGVVGIGCAACGSFILSALGITGAVAILPLKGAEFGLLSVGLLSASIFFLSREIISHPLCPLPSDKIK